MDIIDRYISLFRGRGDCYGSWEGGCIKEPLTRRQFEQHLTSGPHIGVYPLITDHVSWGCIDIDGKDFNHNWQDMWTLAQNLRAVLQVKDVYAHPERTRNGYHLWVFPDTALVPAAHMRRALMAACKAIGYNPKEVNPKQEKTTGVGNYVRLPYQNALTAGTPDNRHMVDDNNKPHDIETAISIIEQQKTSAGKLAELAELWSPPQQTFKVNTHNTYANTDLMTGREYVIWRDGPSEGSDRSGTLVRLARLLLERNIPSDEIFPILKSADERWGKFYLRDDCDEQLVAIIEHMGNKIHG